MSESTGLIEETVKGFWGNPEAVAKRPGGWGNSDNSKFNHDTDFAARVAGKRLPHYQPKQG